MVNLSTARDNPEKLIWDEIDNVHAGMLGIAGSGLGMQPMAPNVDIPTRTLWFFAQTGSDLVKNVVAGAIGEFCVVGKNQDFYAHLKGPIVIDRDERRIEEYWSSMVAAWFTNGKDDPDMTLLRMPLSECSFWASTGNVLTLGWEIAKANLDPEAKPDVGLHRHIEFV